MSYRYVLEMKNKKFICMVCPAGCEVVVEYDPGGIKKITGNLCENGEEYVFEEIYEPKRVLTTTVKVRNGEIPLVSVKTSKPIPKEVMFDVMKEISGVEIEAPVRIGGVIMENILDTWADIVATKNVEIRG